MIGIYNNGEKVRNYLSYSEALPALNKLYQYYQEEASRHHDAKIEKKGLGFVYYRGSMKFEFQVRK